MTETNLATLIRDYVQHDEPPFLLSAETSIALARRTLRRRRARRTAAGIVITAATVVAVPLLNSPGPAGHSRDKTGIDPATVSALRNYDAQQMPRIFDERVRAALSPTAGDIGPVTFVANDDQEHRLAPPNYDRASSMVVTYGGNSAHRFRVYLGHSRSEAEGDRTKACREALKFGETFDCQVSTSTAGVVVTTDVDAVRRDWKHHGGWSIITREELRTGVPSKINSVQAPIDPDTVYFVRTVEAVHSGTFLTTAQEYVKATSLAMANQLWRVPIATLEGIVTDPTLVFPKSKNP